MVVAGILCSNAAFALDAAQQTTLVITGQISLSADMSLAKAQQLALNEARAKAIERAGGVAVTSGALIRDSLMAGSFVETLSHGYIIEETVLGWEGKWHPSPASESPPIPTLKVRLRATVEIPPRGFLRHHVLKARLEKPVYTTGDTTRFHISADDDMHILIANYTINDEIVPIYPNPFVTDNLLQKGTSVSIPGDNAGYEFQLAAAAGHQRHTEAFMVFGIPADATQPPPAWTTLFPPGQPLSYADYHRRLAKLPISWIAERILVYDVLN